MAPTRSRATYARVRLVRAGERRGKEAAQQRALEAATGEILVFSDVATALAPDAVSSIVANFADPTVGCVSSVDRLVDAQGRVSGEGAYVRYEMWLRAARDPRPQPGRPQRIVLRRAAGGLPAVGGRSAERLQHARCTPWPWDSGPCSTRSRWATTAPSPTIEREGGRKTRTVVRGLAVLARNVRMLNPFRYGLFAWQLASHKLCRWLVPMAMIAAAAANLLLLSDSPIYVVTFALQAAFYGAAAIGVWTGAPALRIPSFFVLSHAAILVAWYRFARGERMTSWTPSRRLATLPPIKPR